MANITRLTALDTVRARIGLAVELGLLRAGDRLPDEQRLADALSVSRITARRALQSLAEDGLVERVRGRSGGTFIRRGRPSRMISAVGDYRADSAKVHDLIHRRTLMECALAQWAASEVDEPTLLELEQTVHVMSMAATWADYHLADEHFHRTVAQASGQGALVPTYLDALSELYRYFLPYPITYLHGVNHDDHAELVWALRRREPGRAVEVTLRHVSALHRTMFVGLDELAPEEVQPDRGSPPRPRHAAGSAGQMSRIVSAPL